MYKEIYENVVQVGSGTFGSVYFVRDRETGDGAAAKYLRQVTFLPESNLDCIETELWTAGEI